jgi:peroxiredoxin
MLDPDCATAYWGMAMANWENQARARAFIAKAVERKAKVSRREQMWIDGYAEYLQSKSDNKQKKRNYIRSLEAIIQEFPDDIEARAFLVVAIWQFRGELPISSHQAVDALLDQVFQANPMHPAHHYRVHLWDDEKQVRALGSAAKVGQTAPGIAHQWHMAGHIYSGLHRYADAAWQQEASSRVDHAHMIKDRILPDQIHNYAHNQEWLIRDLSHIGRVRDAVAVAKNMIELPRHPRYNSMEARKGTGFLGRSRLLQVLERYELWNEIVALADTVYLEPTDILDEQVKRLRLLGMAHANLANHAKLQEVIAQLQGLARPEKKPEPAPVTKGEKDKKPGEEDKNKKPKMGEPVPVPGKGDKDKKPVTGEPDKGEKGKKPPQPSNPQVAEAIFELQGYEALLQEKPQAAFEIFKKAKNISPQQRARLYLKEDAKQAEELARKSVDSSKDEVQPLANLVYILFHCGKAKEAAEAFDRLRKISGHIDSLEIPVFKRLEPVAKSLKLPADWRVPPKPADDFGPRPPLDSLGPIHWHPSPAPDWKLVGTSGSVSLADSRGKPTIVIFYLGYGCLHCVEQLEKFGPKVKDFADQGVGLVAISTDTVDELKKSLASLKQEEKPAYPLISDAKLDVFKAYRAYDDFERQPLHATFLIDSQGRIRWQDIGHEPFTDVAFLFKETNRLLRIQPPNP